MTDDKNKWSYLAGIFDGEGNVTLSAYFRNDERPTGRMRYSFAVNVINTDLRLMQWLIENFGGVYYTNQDRKHPGWKPKNTWRPKGRRNTENLLLGILPYLIVKKAQANLALEWIRLDGENNPEKRLQMVAEMQRLNRRGISVETNTLEQDSTDRLLFEEFDEARSKSLVLELSSCKIESDLIGDDESAPDVN